MSKYVDALAQARHMNKVLLTIAATFAVLCVFAMLGWRAAPRDLTLYIPPNLSGGAQVRIGRHEVPEPNVYAFAFYIWQQVNRWAHNGQEDYGEQLFKLQAFFTPSCLNQLQNDMKLRSDQGELEQRTRAVMEIPGLGFEEDRVQGQGDGRWRVLLDTQVQESSRGVAVKDAYIRYPLQVVRFDVDRERNPWQLAVDCYGDERPERLDPKAVEIAKSSGGAVVKNTPAFAHRDIGPGAVDVNQRSKTNAVPAPSVLPRPLDH